MRPDHYRRSASAFLGVAALIAIQPALAQDTAPPRPVTITGNVSVTTDYRLRGVSQSDNKIAIQGGVTATHVSGLYGGVWASSLAGWGTFGGPNVELDLIGGYKRTFGGTTVDGGVTYYTYPGGADKTAFVEPFLKVSRTFGPANALLGIAYAPPQQSLGLWHVSGASASTGIPDYPGAKEDNTYLWSDIGLGIPGTKATAKAHVGHSWGNRGLGPNGTSVTPTGSYTDWLLGVDYVLYGPLILGLAYVDTDITQRKSSYLLPNFSQVSNGAPIAGSRFVVTVTAAF